MFWDFRESQEECISKSYDNDHDIRGSFEQIQIAPVYFDREDVKRAIHAPVDVSWAECSNINVFPHGDKIGRAHV